MDNGCLVISLDFEKYWGMRDKKSIVEYEENLDNIDDVIEKTLSLFGKYNIRASWATVGMLFNESLEEHLNNAPVVRPNYFNPKLSPYNYLDTLGEGFDPRHHSARNQVMKILMSSGQEMASHTYSHFYFLEEGIDDLAIESDFSAFNSLSSRYQIQANSIVFPRNQYSDKILSQLSKYGILIYRGNENSWLYKPSKDDEQSKLKRGMRLIDSVFNISGHHTHKINNSVYPINIPSSRFLRPITGYSFYDRLHLRRIKRSMKAAAVKREVYHLWWHPHNFGKDMNTSFDRLEEILVYYHHLNSKYGFISLNMEDFLHE